MRNNPLLDTDFLRELDKENEKEVFARIISLTKDEEPIEQIEGRVTGGSININGSSAVRRSCSIQMIADELNINNFYWGLTNKFSLEIGLTNNINMNYDSIIWFPQGIYLITAFNTTYTTNNYKISINGKDKMCLLNGEVGGNFPNPIDFATELVEYTDSGLTNQEIVKKYSLIENTHYTMTEEGDVEFTTAGKDYIELLQEDNDIVETINKKSSDGTIRSYQRVRKSISHIIREMIHFYGNEPFHNILIKDVDEGGLELLEYTEGDFYAFLDENGIYVNLSFDPDLVKYKVPTNEKVIIGQMAENEYSTPNGALGIKVKDDINYSLEGYYVTRIKEGETAGYRAVALYWPDEDGLVVNVGDTITSVLDKICKTFEGYEYFYNVQGQFVFQKKRTYVNETWTNEVIYDSASSKEDKKQSNVWEKFDNVYKYYQIYEENAMYTSKAQYNFANNTLISSFQHTPDFNNIKNDFMIWGKKEPASANSEGKDIHLRYAIHEKPSKYTTLDGITYRSYDPAVTGEFAKTPNPPDGINNYILDENWWDVKDWAELYKMVLGKYPDKVLSSYYKVENAAYLDLNEIYGPCNDITIYNKTYGYQYEKPETYNGMWFDDWENEPIYVFDLLPDATIGYCGHGAYCSHLWNEWFDPLYQKGGKAYVYKPAFPSQDSENAYYINLNWRELIYQMANDYMKYGHDDNYVVRLAKANPQFQNGVTGYESYYTDFLAYWRDIYDPFSADYTKYFVNKTGQSMTTEEQVYYGWNRSYIANPTLLDWWVDFIQDRDSSIGKYSVAAIGDRTKVVNNDAIKAIIYSETPNIVYIDSDKYEIYKNQNLLNDGYAYMPLSKAYTDKFKISSQGKTAFDELNDLLYQYAYMNEKVTIKAIPIYYLEPNNIITIEDEESKVHGEYIVNKITLQLSHNGMMSITATKAPPRLL